MWRTTSISLGNQRVGQPVEVVFNYVGDNAESLRQSDFRAGCGCSVPYWNPEAKELKVIYTPNPIPHHLRMQGRNSYESTKYILVKEIEKLTFTAIVTK